MIHINPVEQEKIKISATSSPEGGTVFFSGDIDMADPSPLLDPLFEQVHSQALDGGASAVTLDFTQLAFLNSSGIKAIAKWIMRLAAVPDARKYKIKIIHNPEVTWQLTSLPTLTYLVPGSVEIIS
ncbi:MAG: hypothetical protein JXB03_03935 [Spirochaetales bacterium]|nr:hypothetical protein [Spirochaetales bacterium]